MPAERISDAARGDSAWIVGPVGAATGAVPARGGAASDVARGAMAGAPPATGASGGTTGVTGLLVSRLCSRSLVPCVARCMVDCSVWNLLALSLIHISEPTRQAE